LKNELGDRDQAFDYPGENQYFEKPTVIFFFFNQPHRACQGCNDQNQAQPPKSREQR